MLYALLVITNFMLTVCMCVFLNMVRHRNKVIESMLESTYKDNIKIVRPPNSYKHPYDYEMEENFQKIIDDFES